MTFDEAYRRGRDRLKKAGVESPAFDAVCLFQKAFGMDRQALIVNGAKQAPPEQAERFFETVGQRAGRRPLQYILGEWEFMSMKLQVGEGVLIARGETELLVRTAARLLKGRPSPLCLDLCAGTGAVGLGLSSLLPGARVACVERFPRALCYLRRNLKAAARPGVTALSADMTDPAAAARFSGVDAVVANPPYVRSDEIAGLQEEVRREPGSALDGGPDGLDFYRAIAKLWLPRLKAGGVAAVEIGEGQAPQVCALFRSAGISEIGVFPDFNRIDRVVAGIRKKEGSDVSPS